MNKIVTVLAFDPGSKNFGWSVVCGRKKKNKLELRILCSGHIVNTMNQMKIGPLHKKQRAAFVEEILAIKNSYPLNYFVAERYMNRGIRGTLIEAVAMMLDAATSSLKLPYTLLAAVTWKRALDKCGVDLKQAYKWCKATPHQLDATMMGVFALMKILDVPQYKIQIKPIILAIEKVSKEPLTNRVLRRKKKHE